MKTVVRTLLILVAIFATPLHTKSFAQNVALTLNKPGVPCEVWKLDGFSKTGNIQLHRNSSGDVTSVDFLHYKLDQASAQEENKSNNTFYQTNVNTLIFNNIGAQTDYFVWIFQLTSNTDACGNIDVEGGNQPIRCAGPAFKLIPGMSCE